MKRKIVTKLMAIVLAGVLLTGFVTPGFHMSRVQAAEDLFNTRYDFNLRMNRRLVYEKVGNINIMEPSQR